MIGYGEDIFLGNSSTHALKCVKKFDENFYLNIIYFAENQLFFFYIFMALDPKKAKEFSAKIIILGHDDTELSRKGQVLSIDQVPKSNDYNNIDTLCCKCFIIPYSVLRCYFHYIPVPARSSYQ